MAKYDLTKSLDKDFTLSIDDKEYLFRKPTVREMRVIAKQFSSIDESADQDAQLEQSDAAMRELYKFITPIDHDADFAEVLSNQPMGVQIAFNEVIQKELGAK